MTAYPHRIRYTHKIYVNLTENTLFSGIVTSSMTIASYPGEDFKLSLTSSGVCRIKIVGSLNGSSVVERFSFSSAETQYSTTVFDTITSVTSNHFASGVTIEINAVDSVGMPITWNQTHGPYKAEFGQMGGMQAQIEANSLGLGSKSVHYVRIERSAPLSKEMTIRVVGYDDQLWVPISDFENISIPPNYTASEWAFRVVKKQDGD